ncbi:hypothetical protein [Burkholderia singularis]|uniref:Uncharacterized protein n=1 Tax=Burkholderia singularis TaxID=1503053 RepID=A0A238H6T1_9BURK|nr:hypothetical protein [Burkholderia singularis]SMG01056.1 hypothetical protein BSIN_4042 [Burkholderia singularis]
MTIASTTPARDLDARDAQRYRWLRQTCHRDEIINEFVIGTPEDLDAAIDENLPPEKQEVA